jgi:hypothetical protein
MTSRYVTPPGVPPPPGPYVPPGGYASSPQPPPTPRNRGLLITAGLVTAILLATAALVVGIIAINRPTATSANPASSAASSAATGGSDTTAADRALCNAIAPLMKRSTDERNTLVDSGPPGSPGQDAALPKFIADTKDWAGETENVLDKYSEPPRYLTRTLQRYIDDMLLFVESVRPGPGTKYDEAAWTDSTVAAGGPMRVCYDLGVQW